MDVRRNVVIRFRRERVAVSARLAERFGRRRRIRVDLLRAHLLARNWCAWARMDKHEAGVDSGCHRR